MLRRITILTMLALFLLSGCQQNISVSTDPKDSDLAPFHPEVVRGDGFSIQPDVRVFTLYAYLNGPAGWNVVVTGYEPQSVWTEVHIYLTPYSVQVLSA